ncbi:MAG: DUF3089 domain-containing protein [Eubacteriales bacterium]|nr:DUF3089 domain-containing protein [Eubacteriales bacterium]
MVSFLVMICLICSTCIAAFGEETIDYHDPSQWAYDQIGDDKQADLFLVCPTVDLGQNGNMNMSLEDQQTKESFVGALNMERGIYEDTLTMYAPYYRQATFPIYSLTSSERECYLSLAYQDVREAFLAYLDSVPQDRPFVLAGFSQGSDMILRLMKEFLGDPTLQDRLIAAYCIGWRITDEDLESYPWIIPAAGADDVGVVISFNSEAEGIMDSLIVPNGTKTHAINPLNWRTDNTYADASENKGACFTNYSGEIVKEVSALTGAYLDETRGTLKLPDIAPEDYSNSLFPDGVYHLYDYQFFYRNLQENVALRTDAYFSQKLLKDAA